MFELQPNLDTDADLRGSIIHTNVSESDTRDIFGNYTALSYVWGSSDKPKTIYLDGGKTLAITLTYSGHYEVSVTKDLPYGFG